MKILFYAITYCLLFVQSHAGKLNVVTAYPYIASIAEQIGKDRVDISAFAKGDWDPHTVVPRPSFISKLRKADLLIINGSQLEIGWLPPLMSQANNPSVQTGSKGLLDLSKYVHHIDVPGSVSRAGGDVHPEGNPHFYLDPENIPPVAKQITQKFIELDPEGASSYKENEKIFLKKWSDKLAQLKSAMAPLKGRPVIEYHRIFDYFIERYGLNLIATIEPLPGIPPTSRHIDQLEKIISDSQKPIMLQDVYNPSDATEMLSKKYGLRIIILPHDVGAVAGATDIFSLFDEIVRRLKHE